MGSTLPFLWELAFFSAVPSSLFINHIVNMGAITTYVGLNLALVILVGLRSFSVTSLFIASTVLQFVSGLCMTTLSFFDHARSPRPSVHLSGYLLLTLLFDVAETRTFWLASGTRAERTYTSVFTTTMALKAVISLLESKHKTRWISDLYPLDHAMSGQLLHTRFEKHLDYAELRRDKFELVKALCRTLTVPLILPVFPRLILLGLMFCQPFFINSLLSYISQDESVVSHNAGYGFIGASIFIYTGIAISTVLYQYTHDRMLYKARECNCIFVFLRPSVIICAIVALLVSASVVEVAFASWLLYNQLCIAFLAPIVAAILCYLAMSYVVSYTGGSQKAWISAAQKRVGLTAAVTGRIPQLLSGLTCISRIQKFLEFETREDLRAALLGVRRGAEKSAAGQSGPPSLRLVITVSNGNFGWTSDKVVLSAINFEIPISALTIICGLIASGKSTSMRGFIRRNPISGGSVTLGIIAPRVAYCDQTTFLYNGTKDNIVGFTVLDERRYYEVVSANMLEIDIKTMSLGDESNIGSNG
ncbi:hypothetical protein BJ170DRAFT_593227 [Xylariales sp. AK1849]|nr:hypothetical protein BJ170DRAFT_593227 [Xylariales sp. AK1849]